MKTFTKLKFTATFALLCFYLCSTGQNLLSNPDFEEFTQCPTNHGQADRATDWFISIISSDYFNCDYLSAFEFPTTTNEAYSGTGFAGFLSYGDGNGSAEAVGQYLPQSLTPDKLYSLQFASKRPNSGDYTNNCGGFEIYGFKNNPPDEAGFIHTSQHPGALLLGAFPTELDIEWQSNTIDLTVEDTINVVVFTVAQSSNCLQYIFIDSLSLVEEIMSNNTSVNNLKNNLKLYPNPANQNITIELPNENLNNEMEIIDFSGKVLLRKKINQKTVNLDLQDFVTGTYICKIISKNETFVQRFLIQK